MPTSCRTRSSSSSTTPVDEVCSLRSRSCDCRLAISARRSRTSSLPGPSRAGRAGDATGTALTTGGGSGAESADGSGGGAAEDPAGCGAGLGQSFNGVQNTQSGGAAGHRWSGFQPSGGTHPVGGFGQPGGVLNACPSIVTCPGHPWKCRQGQGRMDSSTRAHRDAAGSRSAPRWQGRN